MLSQQPNSGPCQGHSPAWRMSWLMWAITSAFVLFQMVLQLCTGTLIQGVMHAFDLNALVASVLLSSYFYTYLPMQVPAGLILDRSNPRFILPAALLVCVAGLLMLAMTHSVVIAFVSRLVTGAGAAFSFVGVMSVVSKWFPERRLGFMVSLVESLGMLGALFGGVILANCIHAYGWHWAVYALAAVGAVLSLVMVLCIRVPADEPSADEPPANDAPAVSIWVAAKAFFSMPVAWLNGLYAAMTFGVFGVFGALWGIPFLQRVHHLDLPHATLICGFVFIGDAIGAPLFGWLVQYADCRKALMFWSALFAGVLAAWIILLPSASVSITALQLFLLGVGASGFVLTFMVAHQVAPPALRNMATGFTNTFCSVSALLFQPLIGWLLNIHAHSTLGSSTIHLLDHSVAEFQRSMLVMPISLLVAAVLALWLPKQRVVTR